MSFLQEITRPSFLFALGFGTLVSFIFYQVSLKEKEISYQTDNIVSMKLDKSFNQWDKENKDIYKLTGAIWNNGSSSINKEDVREKLSIQLRNIEEIIDYKIVSEVHPSTSKFSLRRSGLKNLDIDWAYFDSKDGFSFQIIYVGDIDPGFTLTGRISDVEKYNRIYPFQHKHIWHFSYLFGFGVFGLLISLYLYFKEKRKGTIREQIISLIGISVSLCFTLYFVYFLTDLILNQPF